MPMVFRPCPLSCLDVFSCQFAKEILRHRLLGEKVWVTLKIIVACPMCLMVLLVQYRRFFVFAKPL